MVEPLRPLDKEGNPPADSTPPIDTQQWVVTSINNLSERMGGIEKDVSEFKGWFKAFLWFVGILLSLSAIAILFFFQFTNLILRFFDLVPKG